VALLDTGREGRTIMLRADLDALPIQEENTHDYCSQNAGVMHACGHDGHTAIMLTVARVLKRCEEVLVGKIYFVFQPAEECGGGAEAMIADGLLERMKPDCCGGLHLWSEEPTGMILSTPGPFMASTDCFEVEVRGKGGHGAVPHHSDDSIVVAAQMIGALQTVVSRRVDPEQSSVLTVGMIQGGEAFNVIPDSVRFAGTVRTYDKGVQEKIKGALNQIVQGLADANGVDVRVDYQQVTTPTVNDEHYANLVRDIALTVPGAKLGDPRFRTMAGEDMAYFLEECPGVYFFVGAGNPDVGAEFPHHHPRFEIDEDALEVGVTVLCEYAARCAAS
jgi:amidohydrolase